MTDNFDRYRKFIEENGGLPPVNEHGNLDKYYVVELMRRGKDNPNLPAANYHFKNYYIWCIRDLEKYEDEIKSLCKLLNLRAYCSVNYKLMSQVALDTTAECARRIAAHDHKRFYSIFESCSGKFVDNKNDLWVVDLDDVKCWDGSVDKMVELIDSMRSGFEQNVICRFPTRSGIHLITHPFNLAQFRLACQENGGGVGPDVKKNHLTLLYEDLH